MIPTGLGITFLVFFILQVAPDGPFERAVKQIKQAKIFPEWGFDLHKGYPTKLHREAIEEYGLTPLHRKSFRLKPVQMELL